MDDLCLTVILLSILMAMTISLIIVKKITADKVADIDAYRGVAKKKDFSDHRI